jgi:hypothetical protein
MDTWACCGRWPIGQFPSLGAAGDSVLGVLCALSALTHPSSGAVSLSSTTPNSAPGLPMGVERWEVKPGPSFPFLLGAQRPSQDTFRSFFNSQSPGSPEVQPG